MMECPRCGFTQPKDRYCANCGLDTDNYTPKKESVGQRVKKNPMLYVVGGIILVAAVAIFLTKVNSNNSIEAPAIVENPNVSPTESLTETSDAVNVQAQNPTPTPPMTPPATPPPAAAPAPPSAPVTDTSVSRRTLPRADFETSEGTVASDEGVEGENAEGETQAVTPPPIAPPGTAVPATVVQPTQIQMQFFEFPRAALASAASQSQIISEGDQYRILLHPNADELSSWLKNGRRLPGTRSGAIKDGSSVTANFELNATPAGGIAPPPTPTNAGLSLDATVSQVTATGASVELRVLYNSTTPVRFGTTQNLTTNSTLLVYGVVPHSGGGVENANPPSNTPLVILDSPDFADNLSEFVIVLSVR